MYSRQCGIGAFGPSTFPDSTSTRARSRSSRIRTSSIRLAYSASVRNCRVPYCAGRSRGTPYSPSVVHSPCRSGSPQGVRSFHGPPRFACGSRVCAGSCTDIAIVIALAASVQKTRVFMSEPPRRVYGVKPPPGTRDSAYCVNFDGGAYQGDPCRLIRLLRGIKGEARGWLGGVDDADYSRRCDDHRGHGRVARPRGGDESAAPREPRPRASRHHRAGSCGRGAVLHASFQVRVAPAAGARHAALLRTAR